MANKIRGITVEIGADTSKLTEGLSKVNGELSGTQKQLKDVEKLLKLDPKNTELLAQKQKLLGDAVKQSKTKLDELKKAEASMKASGVDQNSAQFMALKREIVATEQSINAYTDEAKKSEKATKGAGDAAEKAEKQHSGLGKVLGTVGKAFAATATAAAAGAIAVGKSMVDATKEGAQYADGLLTQATITGMTTDKLQELAYASELVDVSTETVTGAMKKNINAMRNARDGSASVAEAYERLGIAVAEDNGELRDSETVFWETIDALGQIDNETERDALAMELLGKSAQDLNPLIEAGADKMAELAAEAHRTGYVLDKETLESYGELDDVTQRLTNGVTGAKNAIGQFLLPALTDLGGQGVELLGEFTDELEKTDGDINQLDDVVGRVLPKVLDAIAEQLPALADTFINIVMAIIDSLANNLDTIIDGLIPVIIGLIEKLLDRLPQVIGTILNAIVTIIEAVTEALPELMPAIIDAILQIIELLLDPNFVARLIVAVVKLIIEVIKGVVKEIPHILKTLWDAIVNFFGGIFGAIDDATAGGLKKLVNKVIQGINWVIAKPFEGINWVLEKLKAISILGAHPFDWIKTLNIPQIPMLAKGGTVIQGSAIVGEAGPELLTVANGRTVVQPLTNTTNNNTYSTPVNINVYGQQGQNVNELASAVSRRLEVVLRRKEAY